MPRTIVPEEQQRTQNISTLKQVRPTENRVVYVESDDDGAGNFFHWDSSGNPDANADGTTKIESGIPEFAGGGASQGIWVRMQLPFEGATTADLTEDSTTNKYFTTSRAVSAIEGNSDALEIPTPGISMNSNPLTDLASPTNASDAASKSYVDGIASGLQIKESVDVTAFNDIALDGTGDPSTTDGYTLQTDDRILLQGQNNASENGIYVVDTPTDASTWTRATDFDENAEISSGAFTFVENGTDGGDSSYILTTDNPVNIGDNLSFSQFSTAGSFNAGDGLNKSGSTFSVVPTNFAGKFITTTAGGDGNNDLKVSTASQLVERDSTGQLDIDISVADSGSNKTTTNNVTGFNFGNNLNVVDETGSGDRQVKINVNAASTTSIDIDDTGGDVESNVNKITFGSNVDASSTGNTSVSVNVSNDTIQDSVFGPNGVLTSDTDSTLNNGSSSLIDLNYTNDATDPINNELAVTVESDLSNYDNSTTSFIDGIDTSDGNGNGDDTTTSIVFGSRLSITDATTGDGTVTVDASVPTLTVQDQGTDAESPTNTLNFSNGISATGNDSGTATVTNDVRFGTAQFSGDGVQKEFQIAHGLTNAPASWTIEATSDDGSGHSHSTADGTNITVVYDTAPPSSASNNIQLNYSLKKQA